MMVSVNEPSHGWLRDYVFPGNLQVNSPNITRYVSSHKNSDTYNLTIIMISKG